MVVDDARPRQLLANSGLSVFVNNDLNRARRDADAPKETGHHSGKLVLRRTLRNFYLVLEILQGQRLSDCQRVVRGEFEDLGNVDLRLVMAAELGIGKGQSLMDKHGHRAGGNAVNVTLRNPRATRAGSAVRRGVPRLRAAVFRPDLRRRCGRNRYCAMAPGYRRQLARSEGGNPAASEPQSA